MGARVFMSVPGSRCPPVTLSVSASRAAGRPPRHRLAISSQGWCCDAIYCVFAYPMDAGRHPCATRGELCATRGVLGIVLFRGGVGGAASRDYRKSSITFSRVELGLTRRAGSTTWGWVVFCIGVIEVLVWIGMFATHQLWRWVGVISLELNAIARLLMIMADRLGSTLEAHRATP
jgi:hypothetical protein